MALTFDISDAAYTTVAFLPQREVTTHTIENTGNSDVFILMNPIAGTTFIGNSDALYAIAERRLTAGDRVSLDANVKTVWAVSSSDYKSTIETGIGTIY